jgi:hypothetical protein
VSGGHGDAKAHEGAASAQGNIAWQQHGAHDLVDEGIAAIVHGDGIHAAAMVGGKYFPEVVPAIRVTVDLPQCLVGGGNG